MLGPQGISSGVSIPAAPGGLTGARVDAGKAAKLADTAKEFEATFLSMLLKEMRQTLDEDGGFFPGDKSDTHGGLFDLYLGRHLADGGGVGMAAALLRDMTPSHAVNPTDAAHPAVPPPGRYAPRPVAR
jgi:flagellar protein FlgJ